MKTNITPLRSVRCVRRVAILLFAVCGLVGASSAGSAIATALTDGGTTYVHQFENTGVSAVGPLGGGYAYRTASGSRWAATLTPTYTSVSTGFTHHQGQFVEVSTTSPATECRGFYYSYRPLPTGSVTIAMRVDSMTGPGPCAAGHRRRRLGGVW